MLPTEDEKMGEKPDKDTDSKKDVLLVRKVHPLWIRWAHWINFPILTIMLMSGLFIYWANDAYTPFLSREFYKAIGANHKLAYGMSLHFFFMWIFTVNGALYVGYLLFSGEWRELLPYPRHFREAWSVLLHDLGLRKKLPPQKKFNAAQRIAYTFVILMGALALLSGIVMYKPVQSGWLREVFGGYETARLVHFLIAVGFLIFFVVHVLQVVRAGWNKFRAMVVGDEVVSPRSLSAEEQK